MYKNYEIYFCMSWCECIPVAVFLLLFLIFSSHCIHTPHQQQSGGKEWHKVFVLRGLRGLLISMHVRINQHLLYKYACMSDMTELSVNNLSVQDRIYYCNHNAAALSAYHLQRSKVLQSCKCCCSCRIRERQIFCHIVLQ